MEMCTCEIDQVRCKFQLKLWVAMWGLGKRVGVWGWWRHNAFGSKTRSSLGGSESMWIFGFSDVVRRGPSRCGVACGSGGSSGRVRRTNNINLCHKVGRQEDVETEGQMPPVKQSVRRKLCRLMRCFRRLRPGLTKVLIALIEVVEQRRVTLHPSREKAPCQSRIQPCLASLLPSIVDRMNALRQASH